MPAEDRIVLEGYTAFQKDMRQAPLRVQRRMRGLFQSSAQKVISRAAVYAPKRSGEMARQTSITVGASKVTIRWKKVYAGVQEFGRVYQRRTPGGAGTETVTMHKGSPPRFAYKAWNEEADEFAENFVSDFCAAVAETGWWEVR
jgi:hypothetical protein